MRSELRDAWSRGYEYAQAGRYLEALRVFEEARWEAARGGEVRWEARLLSNAGGCHLALFQYRQALERFREAGRLAESCGDWDLLVALWVNLSTLYSRMGEVDSAWQACERGLRFAARLRRPAYRAELLLQRASLRARRGDLDGAIPAFYEAAYEADRVGNSSGQARAWNLLGWELLRRGRLQEAEAPLLQAWRLRTLSGDRDLHLSLRNVGILRLRLGDLRSASRLLEEAVASARRSSSGAPLWSVYYRRGQVRAAQGRAGLALEDFRTALDLARRWRLEVLPADALQLATEVGLQELYGSFIQAAARLQGLTGSSVLAVEAFEAAEENRAASLRALLAPDRWRQDLPPGYWEALARLHAAEVATVAHDTPALRTKLDELRGWLTEQEAAAGLHLAPGPGSPKSKFSEQTQFSLRPDQALLSFHLGSENSYLWGVTRENFVQLRLPPAPRIAALVRQFARAVEHDLPQADRLGEILYGELFGSLPASVRSKPHWLLALDEVLFELPLPALVAGRRGGRPVFLIELHALEIVPGARLLSVSGTVQDSAGTFVGVGDPIYNTADPRWRDPLQPERRFFQLWAGERSSASLQLPRLAASSREIETSAIAWGGPPARLLTGQRASRSELERELAAGPAVLHFATHVLKSPAPPYHGLLALSLSPEGEIEFLSPAQVQSRRWCLGLVVLSGCSSGVAAALPGAGLLGMTRAWLAAGARAVAASRWPTPDDSGELFRAFYSYLRSSNSQPALGAALALQGAQREMLHSRTWRARPSYWAAYFVLARN